MEQGVLYIATGEKYLRDAVSSAKSVTEHNNLNIAVVTDSASAENVDMTIFEEIILDSEPSYDLTDKPRNIARTPFDKTLYIDTDTEIIGDIQPLFSLLDRVDIAAAQSGRKDRVSIKDVPDSFPELNTGVLVFNSTKDVEALIENWIEKYERQINQGRPEDSINVETGNTLEELPSTGDFGRMHDQIPFREALYESDITYSILPEEYNYGTLARSHAYIEVKILHGSPRRRNLLKKHINEDLGSRVYISKGRNKIIYEHKPNKNIAPIYTGIFEYIINLLRLKKIIKNLGVERYFKSTYDKYLHRD